MKRISILFALFLFSGALYAQGVMPAVWSKPANTHKWFKSTGERVRGMAYNASNNHLYVSTRDTLGTSLTGGIIILDGTTGDSIGTLNVTGLTGGVYAFNRLGVTSDGRIYTANLQTTVTKANPLKIYTWADENSAPVLAFSDSVHGPRVGDALSVVGSGQETYVYVSGNATPGAVNIFKRSGDTLVHYLKVVPTGWATGVISIAPTTSSIGSFWVNVNGKAAMKFDTNGTVLDTIPALITSTAGSGAYMFNFSGKSFFAMYSGSATVANPSIVRFIDVTNGGSKGVLTAVTTSMGTNANSSAPLGEVAYNPNDTSVYVLSANNGYHKFSVKMTPPSVAIFQRMPFVPMAGENDTVIFNVLSMKPVSNASLTYFGYRTSVSDQDGIDSADVAMSFVSGIQYSAIVPGSVNRNGRRIQFRAGVTDVLNVKAVVTVNGYFAGMTKLAYTGGPREVDTNGVILHKGYGIRSQAVVIVEDSVFQTANSEIVLQDSLGGVTVFKPGTPFDVKRGNVYVVTGTTDNPTGGGSKFQFVDPGITFTDLGPAPKPVMPRVITIKQLLANGEPWENSLVEIRNVTKSISSPAWPGAGASVNMIFQDASGDSTTMRIDGDTDIDGMTEPSYPITIVGAAGQFDNTAPFNSGYQWLPRDMTDIRGQFFQPVLPLTFDEPNVDYSFLNFSGATTMVVPNPFSGPKDSTPFVAKTVKGAGDPWAGSYVTLAGPVDFSKGKIFKAKVYMPKVGAKMLFKLENGTNGGINKEVDVTATKANEWEELTWDFSTIDDTKEYHKVVIIFDLGTVGDGGANFTYYFDDIRQVKAKPKVPLFNHAPASITFGASLDTAQAGGGGRKGIGTAAFVLSEDRKVLQYQVTVTGLSGTISSAHFHNAAPGVGGGVVKNISFVGNTAHGYWTSTDGTQPLTPQLLGELYAGRLYLNVHTSTFSGGEIRGQIYPANGVAFAAVLDSTQAKTLSSANGTAAVFLTADRSTVKYSVTIEGLEGTLSGAHFHNAPLDSSGGVVKGITFENGTAIGEWKKTDGVQPLTDQLIGELIKGRLYLNVHSSQNPGGEIRGQVRLVGGYGFAALMDSVQAGTNKPGRGTAVMVLDPTQDNTLHYRITVSNLSGDITGAHIHYGAKGVSGGVVKPLSFYGNTASGTWSDTDATNKFTDTLFTALVRGKLYVNIHTAAHPGGEIRGQIELASGFGIAVGLDGKQANTASQGKGTGWVEVNPMQDEVKYQFTINDLTGSVTNSHFHNAQAGVNGGVVKNMTFTNGYSSGSWKSTDGTQPLTGALLDSLFTGALYVNIHSSVNAGGEIRGQLEPGRGSLTSVKRIGEIIPTEYALDQNYPNPFNPTTTIQFALPNDAKVSLKIFDILGREVRTLINTDVAAGMNRVEWNGKNAAGQQVASGMYIYRIEAGAFVSTKKMLMLK